MPLDKGQKAPNYQYTLTQVLISIKCFLDSSAGFRCLSSIFQTLRGWVSWLGSPSFTTIRQWLLKIGLHNLSRPKYSPHGWFFIIDTSIQMGPQKCVVVLGVKKIDINQNFCPTLNEVELLVLKPLSNCPGEVVNDILEEAVVVTGAAPLSVISDEGSENKKGVRLFCHNHPETIHLFDISHQINTLLKKELANNDIWAAFRTNLNSSMQHLKLSSVAYLAPPRQRVKDRMHSAFSLVEWGVRAQRFINSEEANALSPGERSKIDWLENYQFALPGYICFRDLCKEALALIHEQGYYLGVTNDYIKRTEDLCRTDATNLSFRSKILEILQLAEKKISHGIHYLGSSEVIESLFGKFKALEGDHASSGLTSLVLALPALTGRLDESTIKDALETTSVTDIEKWIKDNMGQTYLSKRRHALNNGYDNDIELDLETCE